MTNDLLETVKKHFKLHVMDFIYPSKYSIRKNCVMLYSEIENTVLQS